MAERLSALAHLPAAGVGGARIALSEARPGTILQIQVWADTLDIVRGVIDDLLGAETPAIGTAVTIAGVTVLAIAPGRYLVCGCTEGLVQKFEAAVPSGSGAVTDISHGRTILELTGKAAADVLATSVTLDLDPRVFPPGRVAQTMIHHIDVVIHRRTDDHFEIWVLRSFAEALAEWLLDQGLPFGIVLFTRPPASRP